MVSPAVMGSTSCLPDEDDDALQALLALGSISGDAVAAALPPGWDKESALRRLSEHLQAVDGEISKKAQCLEELDAKLCESQEADAKVASKADAQVSGVAGAAAVSNVRSSDVLTPRPVSSVSASTPVLVENNFPAAKALSASQTSRQGATNVEGSQSSMCGSGALNPIPVQELTLSTPRCKSQPPFGEKRRFVSASSIAPSASSSSAPSGAAMVTTSPLAHAQYQQHQVHRLTSAPVGWQASQIHGHSVAMARQRAYSPQHLGGLTYVSSTGVRTTSPAATVRSGSTGRCGVQVAMPTMLLRGSMGSSIAGPSQNPVLAYIALREASPDGRAGYASPPMPSQGPIGAALGQQAAVVGAPYQGRFAVVPPAATPARSAATQQSWNPSPTPLAPAQAGSRFVLVSPADRPMTPRDRKSVV